MTPALPLTAPDAALVYILNAAWELPLIAGAGLAVWGLAPSHARRGCSVWVAVLSLGALVPVLSAAGWALESGSERHGSGDVATHLPEHGATAVLIVGVAVLASLFATLRLAAGWLKVRRLVARSTPVSLPPALAAPLRLFAGRHDRAVPAVRLCRHIASPAVAGARRPVVLLPLGFEQWGEEEARAALLHECAHILRRDYLSNIVCELVALPVSWHPIAHLLKRPLRAQREVACDRLAAQEFGSSLRYARALLRVAAGTATHDAALLTPHLIDGGGLERRVRALLAPPSRLGALGSFRLGAATFVGIALLAPLVCLRLAPEAQPDDLRTVARVPAFYTAPLPATHVAMRKLAKRAQLSPWSVHRAEAARHEHIQAAPVALARAEAPKDLVQGPPVVVLIRTDQAFDDAALNKPLQPLILWLIQSGPPCAARETEPTAASLPPATVNGATADAGVDGPPTASAPALIPPPAYSCSKAAQLTHAARSRLT
jgi:beta-lactamase regulating signal transducer with metallopeptidase domain